MPYIRRIRIANVRYDKGTRLIPDIIFEPEDLNMITLMPNGEGKTTIIQLIIQTVLPNQSIQGRNLRDTLLPGNTGHVVVEWRMDGDEERYVCTGFCFHFDKNKNYSVFNYVWDYMPVGSLFGEEQMLDIAALPLAPRAVQNRPIGYQEYRDWLHDHGIQTFQEFYKYKDKIREYRIVPEEWKFIAEMNNDEAGASGIFVKAKSTINLLDQLLIPQIERMIYNTDEKASKIISIFQKHQEILLNIPIQRRNIQSLGVMINESDTLLAEIKQYNEAENILTQQINEYRRLCKLFEQLEHEKSKQKGCLEEESRLLENTKNDLSWKIESYPVFTRAAEKEEKAWFEQEQKVKLEQEEANHKECERLLKTLRSFASYQEIKKRNIELQGVEEQIYLLDLQQPELLERIREALHTFAASWKYQYGHKTEILAAKDRERQQKSQEVAALKESIVKNRKIENQWIETITELKTWLEEMKEEHQKTESAWGEAASNHPAEELKYCKESLNQAEEQFAEKKEEKSWIQKEFEEKSVQIDKEKDDLLNAQRVEERTALNELAHSHQQTVNYEIATYQQELVSKKEKARRCLDWVNNKHQSNLDNWHKERTILEKNLREEEQASAESKRQEKEEKVRVLNAEHQKKEEFYRTEKNKWSANLNDWQRDIERKQTELSGLLTFIENQEESVKQFENIVSAEAIYDFQEKLTREYQQKRDHAEKRRSQLQHEGDALKERLLVMEEKDYFVPHRDLTILQNHVNDQGLQAMLGNEWLSKQQLSDQDKESILEQFPLLPYSLLVYESDLSTVEAALSLLENWVSEIPLLIMSFEMLKQGPSFTGVSVGVKRVGQGLFVFQGTSAEVFISPSYFQNLKTELSLRIAVLEQDELEASIQMTEVSQLLSALDIFYAIYQESEVSHAKRHIPVLTGQIEEACQKVERVESTIRWLDHDIIEVEKEWQQRLDALEYELKKALADISKHFNETILAMEAEYSIRQTQSLAWAQTRGAAISKVLVSMEKTMQFQHDEKRRRMEERYETEKATISFESDTLKFEITKEYEVKRIKLRDHYRAELQICEKELERLASNVQTMEKKIEALMGYKLKFQHWGDKKSRYHTESANLESIRANLVEAASLQESLEVENNALNLEIQRHEMQIDELQKDYNEHSLPLMQDIEPDGDLMYEEEKKKYQLVKEALKEKQGSRDALGKQKTLIIEMQATSTKQMVSYGIYRSVEEIELLPEKHTIVTDSMIDEACLAFEEQTALLNQQWKAYHEAESQAKSSKRSWEEALERYTEKHDDRDHYNLFDRFNHKVEHGEHKREFLEVKQQRKNCDEHIQALHTDIQEFGETIRRMQKSTYYLPSFKGEPLPVEDWLSMKLSPRDAADEKADDMVKNQKSLEVQKQKVIRVFDGFKEKLNRADNEMVRLFVRRLDHDAVKEDMVLNYEIMSSHFATIKRAIEAMKEQIELNHQESNKTKDQIAEYCLARATEVYKNIKELAKNSKIHLYGKDVDMVNIDWLNVEEPSEAIRKHLDEVIEVAQTKEDIEKRRRYIEESLSTRNLVNQVAPLSSCKITAFKPRKEGIIVAKGDEYEEWDKVHNWSGGEQYAVYLTMYMIMVNHVRKQADGKYNVFKTIVADNPFGKASSGHILKPIFEVAEKNQVKLICFTAHRADEILSNFPTCYSLKGRNVYGMDVMSLNPMHLTYQLEAGYVKK